MKPKWRVYEIDDCHSIAAKSLKDAINYAKNDLRIDEDCMYPHRADMKNQYTLCAVSGLPVNRRRNPHYEDYEGQKCICLTFKKALRNEVKKRRSSKPFVLSVCGI